MTLLNEIEIQTRGEISGLMYFDTLESALSYAEKNKDVWKISFSIHSGERVRLVKDVVQGVWVYDPLRISP